MIEKRYKCTCDRCHKESDVHLPRIQIQMYGKMTSGYKGYITEDRYDVCPECMRKIIGFLKEEQNHG